MSITVNPPQRKFLYRKDSATSVPPLVTSLDPAGYGYTSPQLPNGNDVKVALDELFRLSTPKAEPGWQLFESSGSFVVPSGVTEVLVLSIGAGGKGMDCLITQTYPASGGIGAYALSKYVSGKGGRGYVNPSGTPIGSISSCGGGAGGGFLIPSDVEDTRSAWLAVALNTAGEGIPANGGDASKTAQGAGGSCWPDTSRSGTKGTTGMGGSAAGSYGGGGGGAPQRNGSGTGGPGGKAALMVFWGPDIRPDTTTSATSSSAETTA